MRKIAIVFVTLISFLLAEAEVKHTLTTSGEASVLVTPDVVFVTIGIQRDGLTAQDAQEVLKKDTARVLNTLIEKELLPVENISTDQYLLYPIYRKKKIEDADNNEETLIKYRASLNLRCKITRIDQLAEILDTTVSSGANKIEDVDFSVSNPQIPKNQALQQAIENARIKAQLIADSLNVQLLKPLSINENYSPAPYRTNGYRTFDSAGNSPSQLPSGMSEMKVRVDLVYEIN